MEVRRGKKEERERPELNWGTDPINTIPLLSPLLVYYITQARQREIYRGGRRKNSCAAAAASCEHVAEDGIFFLPSSSCVSHPSIKTAELRYIHARTCKHQMK